MIMHDYVGFFYRLVPLVRDNEMDKDAYVYINR